MLFANPRALFGAYPQALRSILSVAAAHESRQWLSHWDGLNPGATPLYALPGLARELGVGSMRLKDESVRSRLASFKALGAPIALARLIMRTWPDRGIDAAGLFSGAFKSVVEDFTVVSATDGNHGRGLAAAARSIGCRCVIVLHAHVSDERESAIAQEGARIVRIAGNYDDSVAEAARLAAANGWHVVSDTSYAGYEDIPRDVMQGYGTIAAEVVEQHPEPFTHVIVQGGVGGLAAGIASYLWEVFGERRPRFVIVEPEQADCLYQSAVAGVPSKATGSVDSVMAGLACGETSPLAWRFLVQAGDFFMTVPDDDAVQAMRMLARAAASDVPVVSGESGAAGLAGLASLVKRREWAAQANIDAASHVLLINTEGATAPSVYEDLAGESAQSVMARQRAWLQSHAHR